MHEIDKTKLSDQTKFRLHEIKKIENYFINEINESKSCSEKLNKYVTIFDYTGKSLIILSATTGGISIISFTSIIGVPAGIASVSHLLSTTRKKKKKDDQILMPAKSKFNSLETLISQALNDMNISHEEFIAILKEKDRYEKMKENIRDQNENKKQEL